MSPAAWAGLAFVAGAVLVGALWAVVEFRVKRGSTLAGTVKVQAKSQAVREIDVAKQRALKRLADRRNKRRASPPVDGPGLDERAGLVGPTDSAGDA